jgi:acyl dehydratase
MAPVTVGPLGQDRVAAFALASGDNNPLHVSTAIALTIGLEAAPVHGMLLVAFLHEAVRRHQPDATILGLSTRFMAPVPVGETIEISGRVVKRQGALGPAVMRIMVKTSAGVLACIAEAELAPPQGGWIWASPS